MNNTSTWFWNLEVQGRANTIAKPSTIKAGRDLSKYFPTEVFYKPKIQLLLVGATFQPVFMLKKFCPEIQI